MCHLLYFKSLPPRLWWLVHEMLMSSSVMQKALMGGASTQGLEGHMPSNSIYDMLPGLRAVWGN